MGAINIRLYRPSIVSLCPDWKLLLQCVVSAVLWACSVHRPPSKRDPELLFWHHNTSWYFQISFRYFFMYSVFIYLCYVSLQIYHKPAWPDYTNPFCCFLFFFLWCCLQCRTAAALILNTDELTEGKRSEISDHPPPHTPLLFSSVSVFLIKLCLWRFHSASLPPSLPWTLHANINELLF